MVDYVTSVGGAVVLVGNPLNPSFPTGTMISGLKAHLLVSGQGTGTKGEHLVPVLDVNRD